MRCCAKGSAGATCRARWSRPISTPGNWSSSTSQTIVPAFMPCQPYGGGTCRRVRRPAGFSIASSSAEVRTRCLQPKCRSILLNDLSHICPLKRNERDRYLMAINPNKGNDHDCSSCSSCRPERQFKCLLHCHSRPYPDRRD